MREGGDPSCRKAAASTMTTTSRPVTLMCDLRHCIAVKWGAQFESRCGGRTGGVMVAKYSNPSCPSSFRPLKEGRVFRLENDLTFRSSDVTTAEHFWLCHCCSSTMPLHLTGGGSVIPVVLRERVHNGGDFISANRQKGRLLSSVSFSTERHRGGAGKVGGEASAHNTHSAKGN